VDAAQETEAGLRKQWSSRESSRIDRAIAAREMLLRLEPFADITGLAVTSIRLLLFRARRALATQIAPVSSFVAMRGDWGLARWS
jgi:hypothetical protein